MNPSFPDAQNGSLSSPFVQGRAPRVTASRGTYTGQELQVRCGVSARTLRHWIRQKVVPKPIGRGRGARYDEGHLIRARIVQHLRNQRVSLHAIRSRIESLSEDQLLALLPPEPRATTPEGLPMPPPPPTYPFQTWEMVHLMDGLFLMVNPTKGEVVRRIADEVHRYYGSSPARPR